MQLTFNVARRKLIVVSLVIKITFIEIPLEILPAKAEKSCFTNTSITNNSISTIWVSISVMISFQ